MIGMFIANDWELMCFHRLLGDDIVLTFTNERARAM